MIYLLKGLENLLSNFEIRKNYLSANDRRLMHRHFRNLAIYLKKEKNSTRTVSLTEQLADHGYKSAECEYFVFYNFIVPLKPVEGKSSEHVKLGQALIENRQKIFHLLSIKVHSFLINELPHKATSLTQQLNLEIQKRENKIQEKGRKYFYFICY